MASHHLSSSIQSILNISYVQISFGPIQLAAYSEGVCVPDGLDSALHVFSTAEAIECLNSTEQGRVISVTVCRDSYTRQLFIGLADVLLGRPSDEQITTQARRLGLLAESNERLAHLHGNDTSFPDVQYPMECFGECYGKYSNAKAPFSVRCSGCVNDFTSRSEDAVGVVGAGVHNLWYFGERVRERMRRNGEEAVRPLVARDEASGETAESVNETIRDLERFLDLSNRTICVSMPSYQVEKRLGQTNHLTTVLRGPIKELQRDTATTVGSGWLVEFSAATSRQPSPSLKPGEPGAIS